MKIVHACMPEDFRKNFVDADRCEDIEKYVKPSDTPSWWYDDDSPNVGVQQGPHDKRTCWKYVTSPRKILSVNLAEI